MKVIFTALLLCFLFTSCSSKPETRARTEPKIERINFPGQKTRSRLKYQVLRKGRGKQPRANSKVTVHYRGTFLDGREFDSSYRRNQPSTFYLSRVIRGWTEGVQLMRPGAKYRFLIPSHLAYGRRGNRSIPPNSTLIFDIELIRVH